MQDNTKKSFTQPPAQGLIKTKFGMPSWDTWHILSHFLVQKQQQKMPLPPLILTAIIFNDARCLTKVLCNPSPTIELKLCSNSTFVEIGISNRFCLIQGNPSLNSGEGKALNVERFDQIKFSLTKCSRKQWLYCQVSLFSKAHHLKPWNWKGTKKKSFQYLPKHPNFGRFTLTFYSLHRHCILLILYFMIFSLLQILPWIRFPILISNGRREWRLTALKSSP